MTTSDALRDDVQLITFRVGGQDFAFGILDVERILRWQPAAPLPTAPAFLEGVIPFEGGVAPVLDLRRRLEVPSEVTETTRLVVVRLGEERVAVVVDAVLEVLRVDAATISAPPALVRGLAAAYIAGIVAQPARTILVLNPGRILTATERLVLTQLEVPA